MKRKLPKQLVVGERALMPVGSPVRQWMFTLENKPKAWLVPVQYAAPKGKTSHHGDGPRYIEVTIASLMDPYAIVYHHDGEGWVRLWINTREVQLLPEDE